MTPPVSPNPPPSRRLRNALRQIGQGIGGLSRLLLLVWFILVVWGIVSFAALWPLRWWWGGWPAGWTIVASVLVIGVIWRHGVSWVTHTVGVLVTAATVAIALGNTAGYIGKGTPAPPDSITNPVTQAAAVFQWADSVFEGDLEPHHFDEQRLTVHDTNSVLGLAQTPPDTVIPDPRQAPLRTTARVAGDTTLVITWALGPHARVIPAIGSHRNARSDYKGSGNGKGRIIMKFEVDSAPWRGGGGYGKLRLPPGTSYLWVDNMVFGRHPAPRSPGMGQRIGYARGLIITPNGAIPTDTVWVEKQKRRWSSDARSKWRWDPADECVCNDCLMHGWCGFGCSLY